MGSAIEAWLAELKPVQVKELKEAFETMEKEGKGKGGFKPERFTRAHAREAEVGDITGNGVSEGEEVDDGQFFSWYFGVASKFTLLS